MNTPAPLLTALAALLPVLALMVSLCVWVRRHRQPDVARIRVLRGLLRFLFLVLLAWLTSLILFSGADTTSAKSVLLPLSSLLLVGGTIAFQIHQCQRRLGRK